MVSAEFSLTRDSGYADRLRNYSVIVDGKRVGTIGNGQTKSFPIAPGEHTLKLKIAWCGSNTIQFLAEGSRVTRFQCTSSLRGLRLFLGVAISIFTPDQYLQLRRLNS